MKIVFVHLGVEIPDYLLKNIRRAHEDFPKIPIVLITDAKLMQGVLPRIQVFPFEVDDFLLTRFASLDHPKDFRNGFWYTTIYRFFAIENYMQSYSGEILHVESDVRIARDFPFEKFTRQKLPVAYPLVDETRGIASTLYFRDLESIQHFLFESLEIISRDSGSTDMTLLRQYQKSFPEKVLVLPIGPVDMIGFESSAMDLALKSSLSENINYFEGYFDGYSFGQYYFGTDPRNTYGVSKTRAFSSSPFISSHSVKLKWAKSRDFPFVATESIALPLYSLHFHVKRPKLFSSRNLKLIYFLKFTKFSSRYRFVPGIFLLLVIKKFIHLPKGA